MFKEGDKILIKNFKGWAKAIYICSGVISGLEENEHLIKYIEGYYIGQYDNITTDDIVQKVEVK
jgi:hypothetical protein